MNNRSGRAFIVMAALALMIFSLGCRKERFFLIFSHEKHVVENEIACVDCHQATETGAMTRPDHDVCSNCHEIDEAAPSEDCLVCHKAKTPAQIEALYPVEAEKPKEISFSHERHGDHTDVACEECHVGAKESASAKDRLTPSKEACLGCHNDETAPLADCSVCHVESSPVNATHKLDWEVNHGPMSKFAGSNCLVCHREDACIECHQDKKPRDHNNTWRKITHGSEAAWNRSRCMVCHQEDFCERCHEHTKPRSHTAGWASGPTRHCFQCHLPVGAANCSVCHKTGVHPAAPASPHPPFVGFICEECHPTPAGIFPPHPNPGFDCTFCHER